MMIRDHRIDGVRYVKARSFGGPISPSLIVLHDTAGRLTPHSSVEWFQNQDCKVSAHVVIERDGAITQMVPFDRKAFHAGQSKWDGRTFLNGFSVGIEIVSPGKLDATGKAWFGACTTEGIEHKATDVHGDGWWLPYTEAQIASVVSVCRALCEHYPEGNEIIGHHHCSPGRKIDPNPLFPWDRVIKEVFEHEEAPAAQKEAPMQETAATTKKIAESRTAQGAGLAVSGGAAIALEQLRIGVEKARAAPVFDWWPIMDATVFNFTFWLAAASLIGSVIAFRERWLKPDIKKG